MTTQSERWHKHWWAWLLIGVVAGALLGGGVRCEVRISDDTATPADPAVQP